MGIDDIKNLIREVSQADIDTFEYEENNTKIQTQAVAYPYSDIYLLFLRLCRK